MSEQVAELAFRGQWDALVSLVRQRPALINTASAKGYTPLHQAAWHGAGLPVVGELLALGAHRGLETNSKHQTAQAIAGEKHPDRSDLQYVLCPAPRTLAQLMRKVAVTDDLFTDYDGNQTVWDRLIECFGADRCPARHDEVGQRVEAAFMAVTGVALPESGAVSLEHGLEHFRFTADGRFWRARLLPALYEHASRAHMIPIEKAWATIADLFDPAPDQWGLRGDLFLWFEMRHALCHVELPPTPAELAEAVGGAFRALTGIVLTPRADLYVKRLARGGMSSGMVSCAFWADDFIPLLKERSRWLQETWPR